MVFLRHSFSWPLDYQHEEKQKPFMILRHFLILYLFTFYTPDFIPLLIHPPTVPHTISPSQPSVSTRVSPPLTTHVTRPLNYPGPPVFWGLHASSLTEPKPGSPLLYLCWVSYQLVHASWWEISGVQVNWDCWSSCRVALLLSLFQLFLFQPHGQQLLSTG